MLKKSIAKPLNHETFRHSSHEILRIEALSDAVFAFSVSLRYGSIPLVLIVNQQLFKRQLNKIHAAHKNTCLVKIAFLLQMVNLF